jgi:hypothetical protein
MIAEIALLRLGGAIFCLLRNHTAMGTLKNWAEEMMLD